MHDFHGWDMGAAWEDIKFATKHCSDISKVATVGREDLGEVDGDELQAIHHVVHQVFRRG